eukprot:1150679-Pelagomonas_calceolata.AAC.1
MGSTLHNLSGCQCPAIHSMVIERHNIASIIILKVVSEGSYGLNLLPMDVGSTDWLAQHGLHITEQISNLVMPPCLFDPSIPDQARRTSSRPDAILITPCPANSNRPPTPSSHRVLCSMRRNGVVRNSTTPARQLHELNIHNRHIHLIEINHCGDTKPGALLEVSQQQHKQLCQQLQGADITLHTILLGIDPQRSTKPARMLHAHTINRLTTRSSRNPNRKYRGLRILHGSADGASLGGSGDGGGPGIEPLWR